MKIYLTALIRARSEYRAEILSVLQHMVEETRQEEACELYRLHQAIDDDNIFTFYEIWKSQAGLDNHNRQSYIQAFGKLIEEKLQEPPTIWITTLI
ncbi:antibiotic biosynthesis monooxygenase [Sphingobacterium faecium]|uniref:putative quinol monooxygenase n=1 Tax=Sphingobacterium faecium TaxID=34087 RepID=UPI0012926B6A|nr:putative quinol monooxygenase [Sphingobacterium faecium]MQP28310.1 antibiotic biosynthesis monooxygenase [Sphingobacterium faecium]